MAGHDMNILASDTFWALIALLIFLALLIYMKLPQWLTKRLDDRAIHIKNELEEARRLREQAQRLLVEYQKKRAEINTETQELIASAKREAKKISEEANEKLKTYIERCNKLAEEKIAQAERDAIKMVQGRAVDLAIEAVQKALSKDMDEKTYDHFFANSLENVKKSINR